MVRLVPCVHETTLHPEPTTVVKTECNQTAWHFPELTDKLVTVDFEGAASAVTTEVFS